MIDERGLAKFREMLSTFPKSVEQGSPHWGYDTAKEMADTLEALWKVARAADGIVKLLKQREMPGLANPLEEALDELKGKS